MNADPIHLKWNIGTNEKGDVNSDVMVCMRECITHKSAPLSLLFLIKTCLTSR